MELDSLTELCLDVLFPSVSPITSASTRRVLSLQGLLARINPRSAGVILERFFLFGGGIKCRRFGNTVYELEPRSLKPLHDLSVGVL